MSEKKQRVLILYGGDQATNPRNELLAWLGRPSVDVDARIVADSVPHSGGAVDDRVDDAIDQADKAIAILTPDNRSPHGAPNVMDEIGRWRGSKGKESLCILRQKGVPIYSNHAGLVYVSFDVRVKEAFDLLREFLLDAQPTAHGAADMMSPSDVTVSSSPNVLLIDGKGLNVARVDEASDQLELEIVDIDGPCEAFLRRLSSTRTKIRIAYGSTARVASVKALRLTHEDGVRGTMTLQLLKGDFSVLQQVSLGGPSPLSVDEIAVMRAERILFGDRLLRGQAADILIRSGLSDAPTENSPIPAFLKANPRDRLETWETLRLLLVQQLVLSGCVEHLEVLKLTVRQGRLVRIELRGRRPEYYANVEPYVLELDRSVDF